MSAFEMRGKIWKMEDAGAFVNVAVLLAQSATFAYVRVPRDTARGCAPGDFVELVGTLKRLEGYP